MNIQKAATLKMEGCGFYYRLQQDMARVSICLPVCLTGRWANCALPYLCRLPPLVLSRSGS